MKRKISLNDLNINESLAQDIFDENGRLLLKSGTVLIAELKQGLLNKGIEFVYIETEGRASTSTSPVSNENLEKMKEKANNFAEFSKLYNTLLFEVRRTALRGKYNKPMQGNLKDDIMLLTRYLMNDDKTALNHYLQIKRNRIEYTYENHALNTAILNILLGIWLRLNNHQTWEAGLTGCLHDIGETRLPEGMLQKKGPLDAEEWALVKTHPILGAKTLLKTEWMPSRVIIGVLMHHERLDGTGYPQGVLGSDIPLYARMTAVSSIFNAMTTDRPYAAAVDFSVALNELRNRSFGQLDAKITRVLYDKIHEALSR
ncbi:HD domain-containing phosphohydrolase [Thermosyntropha sp.]|uniref:HD-GYP domain-containing protein n=1 Tax=Thermosyntropha sp. TaxID=2740820 RepID=UPI0025DBBB26|nr:HD domain-containing phosphohydrolase [Thermosyntropha sp.]MBO8158910.1 HD domain-containing protein [Thermosyntropha sp.]